MRGPRWLQPESSKISWVLPGILLSVYAILDWSAAAAGGDSVLGGLIPVLQILFILCLIGVCILILAAVYFLYNRQYLRLFFYLAFLGVFSYHVISEHQSVVAANKERSAFALEVMLLNPEKVKIWFVDSEAEKAFYEIRKKGKPDFGYRGASLMFHTYIYSLKIDAIRELEIQVLLLRTETRFIVSSAKDYVSRLG